MTTTVGTALEGASYKLRPHSDSPSADVQLLLGQALGRSRAWILAHPEYELSHTERSEFETSLAAAFNGTALPHVLGWWEFFGRRFHLDRHVLIPRPETELMVEEALDLSFPATRILDLGTGSGCIAVTLALELPQSRIVASDLSWGALRVAQSNVMAHEVERNVTLVNSDLAEAFAGPFDLICANLPYLATDQLPHLAVAAREPIIALDGGSAGTELIHKALDQMPGILAPAGRALLEIDPDQAVGVIDQARLHFPSEEIRIKKDLTGRERLLIIGSGRH